MPKLTKENIHAKVTSFAIQAAKFYEQCEDKADRFERVYRARYRKSPLVARIHTILGIKKKQQPRPTHDLLCECRKCRPSHRKFITAIKEDKTWIQ